MSVYAPKIAGVAERAQLKRALDAMAPAKWSSDLWADLTVRHAIRQCRAAAVTPEDIAVILRLWSPVKTVTKERVRQWLEK